MDKEKLEKVYWEASQKWCPFVRVSTGSIGTSSNRDGNNTCKSSRCMAWDDRELNCKLCAKG
jgi:hypothetical protein